jgi:hypothetical protein
MRSVVVKKIGGGYMKIITFVLLFQLGVVFWLPSTTLSAVPERLTGTDTSAKLKKDRISRILPVLESRVGDLKLRKKAVGKLATLDVEKMGLISSLCDKIAMDRTSAGSDIAFSLVSILIILS